jgi:hypothetical protein
MKQQHPYIIAIPTYRRHDTIAGNTLKCLHDYKIPPNRIYLFVADKSEAALYKATVPSYLYGYLVIGVLGLYQQRNFISAHFVEGQHIVELDDDISGFYQLVKSRSTKRMTRKRKFYHGLRSINDLDEFIQSAFSLLVSKGLFLFGVYPVCNGYFMTNSITSDLRFIVGPFFGFINRRDSALTLTISEKEDSERTLQYFTKDGGVLRFNNITFKTNYYGNKGGMQAEGKNRKLESLKSAEYLHSRYPAITKIHQMKKSGYTELKFISPSPNN